MRARLVPDHIKVLDFGLVKELGTEAAAGLSVAGVLLGTPAYLAPEAMLDPLRADARSDLYAVGAVAYHLLAGEPVFEGKTVFEVCSRHLHSEPIPLSQRAAQTIPGQLEHLVLRCLAKNPDHRPASAAAMITELDALEGVGQWNPALASAWWEDQAHEVTGAVKAARSAGSVSGPRTVAIDMARRGTPVAARA